MSFNVLTRADGDILNIGFEHTVETITRAAFEELSQCSTWRVEKLNNREELHDDTIPGSYYLQKIYDNGEQEIEGDILNGYVGESVNPLQLRTLADSIFKLQEEGMIIVAQAAFDKAATMFLLEVPEDVIATRSLVTGQADQVQEYIGVCVNYKQPTASGVILTDMRLACSNMIQTVMNAAHKSDSIVPFLSGDKDSLYSFLKQKKEEREQRVRYYQLLAGYEIQRNQADWYFRQLLGLPLIGHVDDLDVKERVKAQFDSLNYAYDHGEHTISLGGNHTAYRVLNAVTEGTKDPIWGKKHASMFASQFMGQGKSARNKLHKAFKTIIPM